MVQCGIVLNVTRWWVRSISDTRAGLERWAGPVMCGASGPQHCLMGCGSHGRAQAESNRIR